MPRIDQRIDHLTRVRANAPQPPQKTGRDDDESAQPEPQTQELPELPDPSEVGESG